MDREKIRDLTRKTTCLNILSSLIANEYKPQKLIIASVKCENQTRPVKVGHVELVKRCCNHGNLLILVTAPEVNYTKRQSMISVKSVITVLCSETTSPSYLREDAGLIFGFAVRQYLYTESLQLNTSWLG